MGDPLLDLLLRRQTRFMRVCDLLARLACDDHLETHRKLRPSLWAEWLRLDAEISRLVRSMA